MVPRPNISTEDEKAERRYSSSRSHAWEPEKKVRQGHIILKRLAQRWFFFGGVVRTAIFGLAIVMLAGS